jgi:hypothetical protein
MISLKGAPPPKFIFTKNDDVLFSFRLLDDPINSLKKGNVMFFKKKKKDLGDIVKHLALLRMNYQGKSMFLENEEIETAAIEGFLKRCGKPAHYFKLAEDILRFANTYHALVVYLKLKDKVLEKEILENLRDAGVFTKNARLDMTSEENTRQRTREYVETGFSLLMDNLSLSEREITIGAHEILATRFMNFVSDGRLGIEDDKPAWLAFSFAIYQDLNRLPQDIVKAKRKLGLK